KSEEPLVDVEKNVESEKLATQYGVVYDKKDNPACKEKLTHNNPVVNTKVIMVATTIGKQKVNALEGCMNVVVRLGV
nr:hypothetical protein [Tanacetum cinerariifolium]